MNKQEEKTGAAVEKGPQKDLAPVLLVYALVFVVILLLDAGRFVPFLERQAAELGAPLLQETAGLVRALADKTGLSALSAAETAVIDGLIVQERIGALDSADAAPHRPGPATPAVAAATPQNPLPSKPAEPAGKAENEALATDLADKKVDAEKLPASAPGESATAPAPASDPEPAAEQAAQTVEGTGETPSTAQAAPHSVDGSTAAQEAGIQDNLPRVLLTGDSMMMEGFGPVLQRSLRARPDMKVIREGRYSTGLSRLDYFDWEAEMRKLVAKHQPDLVVICLGANDPQDIIVEGRRLHADSAAWATLYRQRAEKLLQAATARGARVIWVGLPVMSREPYSSRVRRLSDLQKAACEACTGPDGARLARFVDTVAALADARGRYMAFAANDKGELLRLRYKDKIHVTEEGGRRLSQKVIPVILGELGLPLQAKPAPLAPQVAAEKAR